MHQHDNVASDAPPVWREFSDADQSTLHVLHRTEQIVEYGLVPGEVGESGRFDLVLGEIIEQARPLYLGDDTEDMFRHIGGAKTPCERLVCDLIVADGLFAADLPAVGAFSGMFAGSNTSFLESDELRLPLHVSKIERGVDGLELEGCPRHVMLVREALRACSVAAAGSSVWRCAVQYPPVPMTMTFDWPRLAADQ